MKYLDKKTTFQTDRLFIEPISETDHEFIRELVNTEGWLKYIGNRNVNSNSDAIAYIKKIDDNPNVIYLKVEHKELKLAIGIITFIQRDYLEYGDIGFAFLPRFSNQGYAYEATLAVLSEIVRQYTSPIIFAITTPENSGSIKLLKKLGFQFEKDMIMEDKKCVLYQATIKALSTYVLRSRS